MPKISIIIPVYNSEIFLTRVFDSLALQTFKNFEIICVNDGSTDNSLNILQHIKESWQGHLLIVNQANQGLSSARNKALEHVQGEYVYFLDSDDWISENFLEKMYAKAVECSADIVLSNIYITDGKTEAKRSPYIGNQEGQEINLRLFSEIYNFHPIMQNKLFRKDLIQDILFPEGLFYEDIYFFVKIFEKSTCIVFCPEVKFYYFQHSNSIMKQATLKLLDIEKIFHLLMTENSKLQDTLAFEYYVSRHLLLASINRAVASGNIKLFLKVRKSHSQYLTRFFPSWHRNQLFKDRTLYASLFQYVYAQILIRVGVVLGSNLLLPIVLYKGVFK